MNVDCGVASCIASATSQRFAATARVAPDSATFDVGERTFRLHSCEPLRLRRVKDHLSRPAATGFRGAALVNFECEDVIAEVQLMPATIYEVKVKTDVLYALIRELRAAYELEDDDDSSRLRLKKLGSSSASLDP